MKFYFSILLGLSLGLAGAQTSPNLLFLLADDMRPDAIAALGNPRIKTPNIDGLIARGTTFTRATCSYPICVVSRAEIITGTHGWENGVDGIRNQLRPDASFWGDALQNAGYETWYVGKWHTHGRPSARGYQQVKGLFSGGGGRWWTEGQSDWKGFPVTGYRGWVFQGEDRSQMFPEKGVGLTPDIDSKFADAAIELIQSMPTKPWFLHVNFTGPHDPLFMPPGLEGVYGANDMEIPPNFLRQHPFDHGNIDGRDEVLLAFPRTKGAVQDLLRVYYSVIDYVDRQIGRILTALEESGQLDNTIVVFASDHGMGVGSHGLRGKQSMYEHTMNVPLILAGPGIQANHLTDAQVYLRELYPTTCELLGAPIPDAVSAESFMPVLRGEQAEHHEAVFGYFRDSQRMIRVDRWKYAIYPLVNKVQLFNLKNDPHELVNLSGREEYAAKEAELAKRLTEWRVDMDDPALQ